MGARGLVREVAGRRDTEMRLCLWYRLLDDRDNTRSQLVMRGRDLYKEKGRIGKVEKAMMFAA